MFVRITMCEMCFLIDCDAAQSLFAKREKKANEKKNRDWNERRMKQKTRPIRVMSVVSPFHAACGRGKNRETDERTNRRTDEQTNRQTWHTCSYSCSVAAWQLEARRSRMRYRNATKLNFMNPDVIEKRHNCNARKSSAYRWLSGWVRYSRSRKNDHDIFY